VKGQENAFLLLACERENIYVQIRNWIRNFLLGKEDLDPNPDPKLGRKWDPDPKKIVLDPQHWVPRYWQFAHWSSEHEPKICSAICHV
jgi:hypothetical protein